MDLRKKKLTNQTYLKMIITVNELKHVVALKVKTFKNYEDALAKNYTIMK